MGRTSTLNITHTIEELKRVKKQQQSLGAQRRIECLILLKSGKFATQEKVASHLGITRQNMVKWLSAYRKGGLSAMLPSGTRNRSSKIFTPELHVALGQKMNDTESPLLGYWDAQRWIVENHGAEVNYHWLRKYPIKHFKTKLKTPRKSHIKKDGEAVSAFFKTTPIH